MISEGIQDIIDRIFGVQTGPLEQFWNATQNVDSALFQERMDRLHADVTHLKNILEQYECLLGQIADGFESAQDINICEVGQLQSPRGN